MRTFLDLYSFVGLDIHRRPLGPLLPAPRLDGTFCSRPLTTSEAAGWLRALLQGTKDVGTFRNHSMKATLLGWCARAGLDKESRAVFGHHCCALNGSEVVYSRQLQTRALRNLNLILRRVRSGLSLEDEAMKEFGLLRTLLLLHRQVLQRPQYPRLLWSSQRSTPRKGNETMRPCHRRLKPQ